MCGLAGSDELAARWARSGGSTAVQDSEGGVAIASVAATQYERLRTRKEVHYGDHKPD